MWFLGVFAGCRRFFEENLPPYRRKSAFAVLKLQQKAATMKQP
jgi:hypothetical protein